MSQTFTLPHIWSGGHYELYLRLGPCSKPNLESALRAIWNYPLLLGPWADRDMEPSEQVPAIVSSDNNHLYGLALIRKKPIPCMTLIASETADSISLCIPLSALDQVFPVGSYPMGSIESASEWRPQIDEWLLELLRSQKEVVKFELAVIGWEPELPLDTLRKADVPSERFDGIVLPNGVSFDWYPPTRHDLFSFERTA